MIQRAMGADIPVEALQYCQTKGKDDTKAKNGIVPSFCLEEWAIMDLLYDFRITIVILNHAVIGSSPCAAQDDIIATQLTKQIAIRRLVV